MARDMDIANYYPHDGWGQIFLLFGFYLAVALVIGGVMTVLARLVRVR